MKKTVCIIISTLVTAIYSAYLPAQVLKLEYSTYLGGGGDGDECEAIAVDSSGSAYVTGWTYSGDFPIENPYQASFAGYKDTFVTKLSSSGSALIYSTYLGGSSRDEGSSIAVDTALGVYVAGKTYSGDFPTENPYQASFNEQSSGFVTKLILISVEPRLVLESGDYNGDGTSDIAIFRRSSGLWSIRNVSRIYFGGSSDTPIPGDYNADGTTDVGIFRPSSGLWGIRGVTRLYFGSSTDRAVPADYNGDGACDVGIFREGSGLWAIQGVTRSYFGSPGDEPVPGDYDGNGSKDIGLFRGSSGLWALRKISRIYFGSGSDTAVPGDYDGSGTWKAGIFRPLTGLWAVRGVTRAYFGSDIDQPVPADYNGDGADDIGIFRGSSGLWGLKGISRVYYGSSGDIPVTR